MSFRREKFVAHGGPDGGDGGNGGNVVFIADANLNTLYELHRRRKIEAKPGENGSGANKTGRRGKDVIIRVPVGTIVRDRDRGLIIHDFKTADERCFVARGGQGGRGNRAFVSAERQVPRHCEAGREGQRRHLELELRLIADVGLVGLPNAGKSTLLSRVSHAEPKIANYPFTTLVPQLGIVAVDDYRTFVMADLPGLIEGASEGRGLGDQFLRHIERTRLILHVIDCSSCDVDTIVTDAHVIAEELASFSDALDQKPRIVVGNKLDVPGAAEAFEAARARLVEQPAFTGCPHYAISAATGAGLHVLIEAVWDRLLAVRKAEAEAGDAGVGGPSSLDRYRPDDLAAEEEIVRERIEVEGLAAIPPHKRRPAPETSTSPPDDSETSLL